MVLPVAYLISHSYTQRLLHPKRMDTSDSQGLLRRTISATRKYVTTWWYLLPVSSQRHFSLAASMTIDFWPEPMMILIISATTQPIWLSMPTKTTATKKSNDT